MFFFSFLFFILFCSASMGSLKDENLITVFDNLTNLESVALGPSKVEGKFLKSLSKSKHLRVLSLFGFSKLSDVEFGEYCKVVSESLEELNIRGAFIITDKSFSLLSKRLKKLKLIDIGKYFIYVEEPKQ
jgi:hypothetical protein